MADNEEFVVARNAHNEYMNLHRPRTEATVNLALWWYRNELGHLTEDERADALAQAEPVVRFLSDYGFIDTNRL